MNFPRENFYSQTDCIRLFKMSVKRFKAFVELNNIEPIKVSVDLGTYKTTALYYPKDIIEKHLKKINT